MEEREREIKQIHKDYPVFYDVFLALIVVAILIFIGGQIFINQIEDYKLNLCASFLDLTITILVLDRLAERRAQRQRLQNLIYKMSSSVHTEARRAVEELKYLGWFSDGSMRGARIIFADLGGIDFTWHPQTDFRNITITDSNLNECVLNGIDMSGSMLLNSRLRKSDLSGVIWTHCRLLSNGMQGSCLNYAKIVGSTAGGNVFADCDMQNCTLERTLFDEASFEHANLSTASLKFSSFFKGNLTNAVFTDAELEHADFCMADLTGSQITDKQLKACSRLWGATMPNGQRYDGSFHLAGDIAWAKSIGVDIGDETVTRRWYANKELLHTVDDVNKARNWGVDYLNGLMK
jgi:uncharacterized protein YjbI with pentapeptide repeats